MNAIWDLHAAAGWAYLLIVAVALLDGLFPVVPAETTIIASGALAASGRLSTVGVLLAAWVGVVAGDLITHELTRRGSAWQLARWTRRERPRRALAWATQLLHRRGTAVVGLGRFVPLGRTSVSLVSGLAAMPRRRYLPPLILGAAAWSLYVVGLGYFGGHAFGNPLVSVGVGVGVSFVLTAVGTAVHRWRARVAAPVRPVRRELIGAHA